MTSPETSESPTSLTGRVRVDERIRTLAARLEPGDIAVIDHPDLDRESAQALAASHPVAVLNAAKSTTGRQVTIGPRVLRDAGIVLVDDLGTDVMALREGEMVRLSAGQVWRGEELVAEGEVVQVPEDPDQKDLIQDAGIQVSAFAQSAADYFAIEQPLLVDGEGVPRTSTDLSGRPVVLVMPGPESARELKDLKGWIRRVQPVIVAVSTGAESTRSQGIRPQLLFGDVQSVSEKIVLGAPEIVLHAQHDGDAPGAERLDKLGRSYHRFTTSGSDEDAAVLFAATAGASAVVTVGAHTSVADFLDRGRGGMAATFFSRLRAADAVVSSKAVLATYRPPIAWGWLAAFLVAALVCLGAALWVTPWGHGAMEGLFLRIGDVFTMGVASSLPDPSALIA